MFARQIYMLLIVGAVLPSTRIVSAHHSVSANFDLNSPQTITGNYEDRP